MYDTSVLWIRFDLIIINYILSVSDWSFPVSFSSYCYVDLIVMLKHKTTTVKGSLVLHLYINDLLFKGISTGFKHIEKINATAPQPQRKVLKYFAIFKNVAHILEPGETPSNSESHQAPNYVQRS